MLTLVQHRGMTNRGTGLAGGQHWHTTYTRIRHWDFVYSCNSFINIVCCDVKRELHNALTDGSNIGWAPVGLTSGTDSLTLAPGLTHTSLSHLLIALTDWTVLRPSEQVISDDSNAGDAKCHYIEGDFGWIILGKCILKVAMITDRIIPSILILISDKFVFRPWATSQLITSQPINIHVSVGYHAISV